MTIGKYDLYDKCPACEGSELLGTDGKCLICKGEKYLPSGLNTKQVDKLRTDNENMRAALTFIKEQLEECPQPTAENGYQGAGVQDWINVVYGIAIEALEG